MSKIFFVPLALLVLVPTFAVAQTTTERPARPYRGLFGGGPPPDPNRTRQELTMTADGTGGYDSWITPVGSSEQIDPRQARRSGFVGTADVALNYRRGRAARALSVEGRGFTYAYSDINADPLLGASVRASFDTTLGRRGRLQATHDTSYQPTLVIGAYGPLTADLPLSVLPEMGLSTGMLEQRSVISTSSSELNRQWSQRQNTDWALSYSSIIYLDNLGFDSKTWSTTVGHTWNLSRRFELQPTYRFDDTVYQQSGEPISMTNHTVELIGAYTRRLSPSRELEISGGGGATSVSTVNAISLLPLDYWMPSGRGSLRLDLLRSWSVTANYRRAVNVIQGITLESFATDAASIQIDGLPARRLQTMVLAAYSNGRSAAGQSDGRYDSFSASLRLRYALGRCCAATTEYDYYDYRFQNVAGLSQRLPNSYDRQAVRFGFALWLPFYGRYTEGNENNGRR